MSAQIHEDQIDNWLQEARGAADPWLATDAAGRFVLASTIGLVRDDNQDRVLLARLIPAVQEHPGFVLVALCDGMGGQLEGARCAEIAMVSVVSCLLQGFAAGYPPSLLEGVQAANRRIHHRFRNQGGTTFTGLLYHGGGAQGVHVGDSRCYRLPQGGGPPQQLTADHNLAASHVAHPDDDPETRRRLANQLTQCLGMGTQFQPQLFEIGSSDPATILLSSDGLHNIGKEALASVSGAATGLMDMSHQLLDRSIRAGGSDNASLALIGSLSLAQGTPGFLELYSPGIAALRLAESDLH